MNCKVIQFKDATLEDLDNIAALHAKSWQENYHPVLSKDYLKDKVFTERTAVWKKRLTEPTSNQQVIIAKVDGKFAGFISVFGANHEEYGTIIDNLHVDSTFKGCGIGTQLLSAAAEWANQYYQSTPLYLEVLACNTNAMGFYASLGGQNIATGFWQTPCDNQAKEYLYSWPSAEALCRSATSKLRA